MVQPTQEAVQQVSVGAAAMGAAVRATVAGVVGTMQVVVRVRQALCLLSGDSAQILSKELLNPK